MSQVIARLVTGKGCWSETEVRSNSLYARQGRVWVLIREWVAMVVMRLLGNLPERVGDVGWERWLITADGRPSVAPGS